MRASCRPIAAPRSIDRDHEQRPARALSSPGLEGQRDGRDQRDGHAERCRSVAELGGLVPGQPGERKDEEERGDEEGRGAEVAKVMSIPVSSSEENMASMRRVTAKPPKTLMQASRTATKEITVIAVSSLPI